MIRKDLKKKTVLIFGAGREGLATFEALKRYHGKMLVFITSDEKREEIEGKYQDFFLTIDEARNLFSENTVIIKSPGIPWHNPFIEAAQGQSVIITSATNIFLSERKGRGKIIGITGTKGKSTTTSMLYNVFLQTDTPARLVGNIGNPAIEQIDASDDTVFIFELSSFMLTDLEVAPDIAVFLNLYEEHMDYHKGVDAYWSAKYNIARKQDTSDLFFYNSKFPSLSALAKDVKGTAEAYDEIDVGDLNESLAIKGEHNKGNAHAVAVVAMHLGVSKEAIRAGLTSFKGLPHRLEEKLYKDILFVNDSISTNPNSAMAAIDTYKEKIGAIILGGYERGFDYTKLIQKLKQMQNLQIFVFTEAEQLISVLEQEEVSFIKIDSMQEPVVWSLDNLSEGKVCLLSPAAPSFGRYKNFEERGEDFIFAVDQK